MWSCQHSLSRKTHVTGSRKTYSIFGIRDFPLFETGDSGFYSTIRASFGIESTSWGGEMQEIAIGITWLNETLDPDYGIEEPYWGPLESGFRIRKIFLVEIQNVGNVSCGVQNPRLWNLEYRSRNLDPLTIVIQNPVPGIRNTRRIIRNPGMSWIPICGMKFCFPNFKSSETSGLDGKHN